MRRVLAVLALILLAGVAVGLWLTAPGDVAQERLAAIPEGDAEAGERVFHAGGCASCHAAPGATGDAKLVLAGGEELKTPFGTFVVPNISPDPEAGIGSWSSAQFANAMWRGVSPDGQHYYPAFPYASYSRATPKDLGDLFAYMKTLPASGNVAPDHDLPFPFTIRRGLGLWKLVNLDRSWIAAIDESDATLVRGRYLVEALGHCGECHTPRDATGGMKRNAWLAGGPAPEGEGSIPNITPSKSGIGSWSADEIADSLESGFTPSFDSFGGSMVAVQQNMAKLPSEDRAAIAAYLKAIPPHGD